MWGFVYKLLVVDHLYYRYLMGVAWLSSPGTDYRHRIELKQLRSLFTTEFMRLPSVCNEVNNPENVRERSNAAMLPLLCRSVL
jgi:hypothetical protein